MVAQRRRQTVRKIGSGRVAGKGEAKILGTCGCTHPESEAQKWYPIKCSLAHDIVDTEQHLHACKPKSEKRLISYSII